MQALDHAEDMTKEKFNEAMDLKAFHVNAANKWEEKIRECAEQLEEIKRAKTVLKENGF